MRNNLQMHVSTKQLIHFIIWRFRSNLTIQSQFLSTQFLVTLTHLNALFETIADRDAMVIRADKLFRLILKTDLNKFKIECYRKKLGIKELSGETDTGARMISRGPFIATFKNESITFVTSLETAARPLSRKRKKRKKKSSQGSISSELSTLKMSVKTEPIGKNDFSGLEAEDAIESKSPKRKKIEDQTGMIIVAEIDHDEISAVSISPTSECSSTPLKSASLLQKIGSPLSLISGNYSSSSNAKKSRRDRSRSSRKSSKKRRQKRSSLRLIKSIGDNSASTTSESSCDGSSCSRSLLSNETVSTSTTTSTGLEQDTSHRRSPSNVDSTVDIREILEENSKLHGNSFSFMPHHMHDPYFYQDMQMQGRTLPMGLQNNHHHMTPAQDMQVRTLPMGLQNHPHHMTPAHMMYAYPPNHYNAMQWQQGYPYSYHYPNSTSCADNIEYEECFLIKGVTSFFKRVFGIDKKKELFEPSPQRNQSVCYPEPERHHPHQFQYNDIAPGPPIPGPPIPRRSRSISRVFDSNDEYFDHLENALNNTDVSDLKSDKREENTGRSLSSKFEQQELENTKYPRPRMQSCEGRIEQSMSDWKAAGPRTNGPSLSITHDFSLDNTTKHRQKTRSRDFSSDNTAKPAGPRTNGPSLPITHDFSLDNTTKHRQRTRSRDFSSDNTAKSRHKNLNHLHEKDAKIQIDAHNTERKKERNILKDSTPRSRKQKSDRTRTSDRKKKQSLSKHRPNSITSVSRSKTDSLSLPKKPLTRPSLLKSSSVGSALSQNRTQSNVGAFHYR